MTIEIHNPELENMIQQEVNSGHFASVEDMLLHTLRAARRQPAAEDQLAAKALEAAARIRELRRGVTLERPEGMSLREYAHIGHKY